MNDPKEVLAATQEYRDEEDALQLFIEEECVVRCRSGDSIQPALQAYNRWAKESGEFIMGTKEFSKRLQEKGFIKRRGLADSVIKESTCDTTRRSAMPSMDEMASIN